MAKEKRQMRLYSVFVVVLILQIAFVAYCFEAIRTDLSGMVYAILLLILLDMFTFKYVREIKRGTIDNPIDACKNFFDRGTVQLICGTILVGVITHFLFLIHVIKNADCWQYSNAYQSGEWEVSIGRWFLPVWDFFRGHLNLPYLTAIISIFVIALVPAVIRKTLHLNKTVSILLAITLMISPYMCIIMTYTYCSDTYSLAFLFAAMAAFLLSIEGKENRIIRVGAAAIFIMLSLAIYQIYLGVVCVLLMIKVIKKVAEEPLEKRRFVELSKEVGVYISGIGLGLGIYYLLTNVILKITNLQTNKVYGAFGNSIFSIIKEIPGRVLYIYQRTRKYFLQVGLVKNGYYRNDIMKVFLVLFIILVICSIWKYRMDIKRAVIYIVGIALVPVVAEGVLLVSPGDDLSLRLSGPLIMCLPLLLHLINWESGFPMNMIKIGINFVLCLYLWTYFLSANATYTALTSQYNQEKTYSQQIVYEIEKCDEYYRGMPVCIIGTINTDEYGKPGSVTEYTYWGNTGNIFRGERSYASARKNWLVFMSEELGVTLNLVGLDTFEQIYSSQEFKEMSLFPKEGSVKVIDGVVVVKLSEEQ